MDNRDQTIAYTGKVIHQFTPGSTGRLRYGLQVHAESARQKAQKIRQFFARGNLLGRIGGGRLKEGVGA